MKSSSHKLFSLKWLFALVALALVVLQLVGCDDTTAPPTSDLPTRYFKDSVQPIFTARCTGCHVNGGFGWAATGSDTGGLDLQDRAYASLVNVVAYEYKQPDAVGVPRLRVKPGDTTNSWLYLKITKDQPEYGGRMPLESGVLSDSEIVIIRKWIVNGAPLGDTTTH